MGGQWRQHEAPVLQQEAGLAGAEPGVGQQLQAHVQHVRTQALASLAQGRQAGREGEDSRSGEGGRPVGRGGNSDEGGGSEGLACRYLTGFQLRSVCESSSEGPGGSDDSSASPYLHQPTNPTGMHGTTLSHHHHFEGGRLQPRTHGLARSLARSLLVLLLAAAHLWMASACCLASRSMALT